MAIKQYKKRPYLYIDGEEIVDKMHKKGKGIISIKFMFGGVAIRYLDTNECIITRDDVPFENVISFSYDKHDIRLEVREHEV